MRRIAYIFGFIFLLGAYSCIEEVDIDTGLESSVDLDDILVVEATLTDQLEFQKVLLSRPSPLDADTVRIEERNARVVVAQSSGGSYTFSEVAPGTYRSDQAFAAISGESATITVGIDASSSQSSIRFRSDFLSGTHIFATTAASLSRKSKTAIADTGRGF